MSNTQKEKKKGRKINELQLIGETYFLYDDRRFNIVISIYQTMYIYGTVGRINALDAGIAL